MFLHFRIPAFSPSPSSTRARRKRTTAVPWITPTTTEPGVPPKSTETASTSKAIGDIAINLNTAQIHLQVIRHFSNYLVNLFRICTIGRKVMTFSKTMTHISIVCFSWKNKRHKWNLKKLDKTLRVSILCSTVLPVDHFEQISINVHKHNIKNLSISIF